MPILFFFFSSRRRHTRWPRDWSSDVCSSDLYRGTAPLPKIERTLAAASAKGYEALLAAHINDHSALFGRVDLDIGQKIANLPTPQLLRLHNSAAAPVEASQALGQL